MKHLVLSAFIIAIASMGFAHSKVNTTIPEDGAVLAQILDTVSFAFANDMRLTRVEMTHPDHPTITLELGDQTSFAKTFTLPVEPMGTGTYQIEWRGLGSDGHPMQGEFSFEVK